MIFDGKIEIELIECYKNKKMGDEEELYLLYKNDGNGTKLKIRIINKMKDMEKIIKNNKLDISKWNTNNVTNMRFLFYNCKSLSSLPDISKWNTNNVIDMGFLFSGCISLSYLPDISKWNTNIVTDINDFIEFCITLLPFTFLYKFKA